MEGPKQFIYHKHPTKYPQQHDSSECGLFAIKLVIETFCPGGCHKAINYTQGWFHRLMHFSSPTKLTKILRQHGLEVIHGHLKDRRTEAQVNFLKKHIEGGPIIVLVAHAYGKKNRFNLLNAIRFQHYVTLRGFDDEKRMFYCYDSHTNLRENDLPVGNMEMNYEDLVSYRKRAGCGLFKKRYIAVKGEAK